MKETTVLMVRKNEAGFFTIESYNYFRTSIKPENLKDEVDRYLKIFILPISTYDP